jgi:hypothetical protein
LVMVRLHKRYLACQNGSLEPLIEGLKK